MSVPPRPHAGRIASMGRTALGMLATLIKRAQDKMDAGQELNKNEMDTLMFVVKANPAMLRSRGFRDMTDAEKEPAEKPLEHLSTEELLAKERERAEG